MSDPRRLIGDDASDFEKELLRSWEAEQPSDAARAGVLAAVGIGVAAATAAKVGAAAGGSIAPKAAATVSAIAIAKWAAVVVGVAAVGATIGYARHASRVREETRVVVPRAPAPAAPPEIAATAPPVAAPHDAPVQVPADVPSPDTSRARANDARARSTPRAHPSALGEQVSALDSARRALAAGEPESATRQLDDYEARFPGGALVEEAEVLRVEALLAQGDRTSAVRVGERFLSAHPNSPHAVRVRALLASP